MARRTREALKAFPKVLKMVWRASPGLSVAVGLLSGLSAFAPAAHVWLFKRVIDYVVAALSGQGDWDVSVLPLIGLASLWVVDGACRPFLSAAKKVLSLRVRVRAESLVLEKAASLDLAFYESPELHDGLERARKEGYRIDNLAVLIMEVVGSIVSVALMVSVLAAAHPLAPVLILVSTLPGVWIGARYAGKRFSLEGAHTRPLRGASYMAELLSSRGPAKEVRVYGLQRPLLERFRRYWDGYVRSVQRLRMSDARAQAALGLLSAGGSVGVWALTIARALASLATVGSVALAFQATQRLRTALSQLFNTLGIYYEHSLFATNLFSFLDLSPREVDGALYVSDQKALGSPWTCSGQGSAIELRDVSFRYPGSSHDVLHGISLEVKQGETIAVVGHNGAGKTTLVKLLCRLYDPTDGALIVNGRDAREWDVDELRGRIGVVFQDFQQYHLTVRENIGFGDAGQLKDDEAIWDAARHAEMGSDIEKLSDRLDTVLGRTIEEGTDLSGGQWQKLALARAFLRDSQVLILDEPTAALDAVAESRLYNRLVRMAGRKTTFLISHRFSTVRMADRIVVLHEGRTVEAGTHDELLRLQGEYARMFEAQARRYR